LRTFFYLLIVVGIRIFIEMLAPRCALCPIAVSIEGAAAAVEADARWLVASSSFVGLSAGAEAKEAGP
jgi:hypothetical protein